MLSERVCSLVRWSIPITRMFSGSLPFQATAPD